MNARVLLPAVVVSLSLVLFSCSSSNGGRDVKGDAIGLETRSEDGSYLDEKTRKQSPAFAYNGTICKVHKQPLSAVTVQVPVNGTDVLDQFAALLRADGLKVVRGPSKPENPEPLEDAVSRLESDVGEIVPDSSEPSPDGGSVGDVVEVVQPPDVEQQPRWTGGEYVIALTGLNDVIFLVEDGTLGVASWCPVESLGQVRRLDYTLADAVKIWGDLAALDYVKETDLWAQPVSFFTKAEGTYQRSYMSESLDINEGHAGQLSVSGKPIMAGFALFGHADAPSQVGDVVGVDLLQVGQTVVAENDTYTVSAQAVRLWDISPLIGEGENSIVVDPFVQDASINWQVGRYYFFADVVFPHNIKGSFVMNLQGAPPGKLLISKSMDDLLIPPVDELFY